MLFKKLYYPQFCSFCCLIVIQVQPQLMRFSVKKNIRKSCSGKENYISKSGTGSFYCSICIYHRIMLTLKKKRLVSRLIIFSIISLQSLLYLPKIHIIPLDRNMSAILWAIKDEKHFKCRWVKVWHSETKTYLLHWPGHGKAF